MERNYPDLTRWTPGKAFTEKQDFIDFFGRLRDANAFYAIIMKDNEDMAGYAIFAHPDTANAASEVGVLQSKHILQLRP
jgi:hypothetical protein